MLSKKYAKALVAVALMGATVLTTVAASAVPVSAKQEVERPFKAKGSGTTTVDTEMCDDIDFPIVVCPQFITQTLTGTHIGRSTRVGEGEIVINFFDRCGPEGIGAKFVSTISDTITAANGDQLQGSSVASGCFVDFVTPGTVAGTWEIDSGTGRFAKATGGGTLSGDVLGDALSTRWRGTLTY